MNFEHQKDKNKLINNITTLALSYGQQLGKADKKLDISTQSYQFRTMSTKSTRGLDYNGKLFEYVIIYEFRCTDPKCQVVI